MPLYRVPLIFLYSIAQLLAKPCPSQCDTPDEVQSVLLHCSFQWFYVVLWLKTAS